MTDEQLEAFAAAFMTLGRLHVELPDDATLAQLKEMYAEWPVATTGPGGELTERGLREWQASFAQPEEGDTIRWDQNQMYGHSASAKVPPFESVHRGKDELVFDEETLQVREEYKQLGLQAPKLNREPDDHIGLEFDFVSQAMLRALTARDNDAPSEADRYLLIAWRFYDQHINQWAPAMLEKAHGLAGTDYLRGLLSLSLGLLEAYAAAMKPMIDGE